MIQPESQLHIQLHSIPLDQFLAYLRSPYWPHGKSIVLLFVYSILPDLLVTSSMAASLGYKAEKVNLKPYSKNDSHQEMHLAYHQDEEVGQ